MDAAQAVEQLLEVSDDVRAAVLFQRGGEVLASNLTDEEGKEVAAVADAMLAYAGALRQGAAVQQLRAVAEDGDVYIRREGERAVAAIALPGALPGLVQHDLRTALDGVSRTRRRSKVSAAP
jgi:predicted regulator of Ras-like GTPase activity (Roadblock/LC7/MglB family)